MVWAATVLACTSVAVSGGSAVYAFSSYTGPDPRIGMSFTFSTFANGGNNVTATVTGLTGGTGGGAGTVTVVLSTQVTDTTGSGTTTALAARPGIGATVYEIWVTGDVVGFPVYVKFEYGTNSANANSVAVFATIGTGTNGAGTLYNPSARVGGNPANTSTALLPCHLSGDAGRMTMLLWHGNNNATQYTFNLERSYDNSGTAIGTYYTLMLGIAGSSTFQQQSLFSTGGATTQEANWSSLCPKTAGSGGVGTNLHVSPVYPTVGGLGNPMTGVLCFRANDFPDNAPVYVTIYGVRQLYIVASNNSGNSSSTTVNAVACGHMVRYS